MQLSIPQLSAAAARRVAARESVLGAARDLIRESGFRGAQMSLIAARAGVGVGSIYQHYPSRADLFAAVFERVVARELSVVESAVAAAEGGPVERLEVAVQTFCTRAIRAGSFAYSLLVEPVEPEVDEHRLAFREGFRLVFARLIDEAIAQGDLPAQHTDTSAAAVLGIMSESLVRPLGRRSAPPSDALVQQIVAMCISAVSRSPRPTGT